MFFKIAALEAVVRKCSSNYIVPKSFFNIHRKTPVLESLLINLQGSATLLKRDSNTGVSCEYCKADIFERCSLLVNFGLLLVTF